MTKTVRVSSAVVAAVIAETAVFWLLLWDHVGGDAPPDARGILGIIITSPAIWIAFVAPFGVVLARIAVIVQYFVLFWFLIPAVVRGSPDKTRQTDSNQPNKTE